MIEKPAARRLSRKLKAFRRKPWSLLNALSWLETETAALAGTEWWEQELRDRVTALRTTVADFAPWLLPEFQEHCPLPEFHGKAKLEKLSLESAPAVYAAISKHIDKQTGEPAGPHWPTLRAALERSNTLCTDLIARLDGLAATAGELANAMNFGLFFDAKKKMLAIGYRTEDARREETHYGLLASEARTALFAAIARGDIEKQCWFTLGRAQTLWENSPVLLSWTGTMFEYLMPLLWMHPYRNTFLQQSHRSVLKAQRGFAAKRKIPWGISESSCSESNPDGHYRYYAFGLPELSLKRREAEELVVSPYSSFLALPVDAAAAAKNLRELTAGGMLGTYGYYDAVDYTRSNIARCWMAHHQGMIMTAAANFLCDASMRRRFHAEPVVAASDRLLQEKIPNRQSVTIRVVAKEHASEIHDFGGYEPRQPARAS